MGAAMKFNAHEDNTFTKYPLVWLDSLINISEENLDGQQLIRSSIDHLKTFDNVNKCEEYIRSLSSDERIILIVSGRLGREIIPRVHQLRQISSIYIYCLDKTANEQWAKQYKKITGIVTKFYELIDKIRFERSKRNQNEINESLSISIYQTNSSSHEYFLYSQLLINVLLQSKPMNNDKNKLIQFCKEKYQNIDYELKLIKEFEDNYSSDKALEWYMKDSFLYRIFTRALRLQNLDILLLFRFFIQDIQYGIKQNICSKSVQVYRSQLMTKEEINLLQNSVNCLISINSFLSTSIYRELALVFLNQSSSCLNNLEHVLFEIYADPSLTSLKPFGFIQSNNNFRKTEEVLFTLGSIFRLIYIQQQSNGLWNIKLILCQDNDEEIKEILKINEKNEQILFGNFLKNIGKINEAEKFFIRLLSEFSDNIENIFDCYYALGCIAMEKKLYDLSFDWHKKSLELKLKILKEDDISLADSYNNIAQIYLKKSDYQQALTSYLRSLKITMQAKGEYHLNVADCYTNLGGIYQKQENYSRALECHQRALLIRQRNLSIDHSDIGISHNNLGIIYSCRGQYNIALEHYKTALEILKKNTSFMSSRNSCKLLWTWSYL